MIGNRELVEGLDVFNKSVNDASHTDCTSVSSDCFDLLSHFVPVNKVSEQLFVNSIMNHT